MPVKTVFQDSEGADWHVFHGSVTYQNEEVLPVSDIPEFIEWLQSEYAKHNPEAKADDEGWIEWQGGECPVPYNTIIDLKWKDGKITRDSGPVGWNWGNEDLIAYRVRK